MCIVHGSTGCPIGRLVYHLVWAPMRHRPPSGSRRVHGALSGGADLAGTQEVVYPDTSYNDTAYVAEPSTSNVGYNVGYFHNNGVKIVPVSRPGCNLGCSTPCWGT